MLFPASRLRGLRYSTAACLIALGAGPAWAGDYLLGDMDQLAVDQPRIIFGLTDETNPNAPVLIGPKPLAEEIFYSALLDTGANGVLLGQLSYLQQEDYSQATYEGNPAIYNELGVAGTEPLEVYEPHGFRVVDSSGTEMLLDDDLIAFGSPNTSLGSFSAIVGMPAMDGRVVEIDLQSMLGDSFFLDTRLHDDVSDTTFNSAASLNVDLRMLAPVHTDTALPEAMRPTFAPLPVIDNVRMDHAGGANGSGQTQTTSNTFLVDTGAQTMIISESMATSLGLDFENFVTAGGDKLDELQVGGIGGTVFMPLVEVEELRLPTADGVDLVFTNILTGVLDIDGAPFDAVLGMNALTSGYTAAVLGGGDDGALTDQQVTKDLMELFVSTGTIYNVDQMFDTMIITMPREDFDLLVEFGVITDVTDPMQVYCELKLLEGSNGSGGAQGTFFDRVVFDFTATDGSGVMRLDLTALKQEGDVNLDGFVGVEDLDVILANWGDGVRVGNVQAGDLTGDGLVNADDLNAVLAHWGEGVDPAASIPEPASAALLGLGLLLLRRRQR